MPAVVCLSSSPDIIKMMQLSHKTGQISIGSIFGMKVQVTFFVLSRTLGDLNFANTFFKNSDFPRTLVGTTLFASGQWQDPASGTVMSQVYFKDGNKDAIQFTAKSNKKTKITKLTDAAKIGTTI